TERDYGIDFYVELADDSQRLTGDLVAIQIKGRRNIRWNKHYKHCLSGISIKNTEYWYSFTVPVFICLVDLSEEAVYFLAAKKYIRENFDSYLNKQRLPYYFNKQQTLNRNARSLSTFGYQYYFDQNYEGLVKDIIAFISNYQSHLDFLECNIGRDFFLGVEWKRIVIMNHIYNLLDSLCCYFGLEWDLDKFDTYKIKSKTKFGDHYDLYEEQLTEIAEKLYVKMKPILLQIKCHICERESTYWLSRDNMLANFLYNTSSDGVFPD
ncbi:MAG: DUF4365 domain-containing protein, partial [Bacteroidia bacterium]|nr:DUF4365 domain-containing protein [Bacteroidia bacterium]